MKKFWISELSTIGKLGNKHLNEDLFLITEDFAAVIDGASNTFNKEINTKTPGRLAAEQIKSSIETLQKKATMEEMILHVNEHLQKTFKQLEIIDELIAQPSARPTASLIVYSRYHHEVWQIGDCQCIIGDTLYTKEKNVDTIIANARSLFLEGEIKKGKTIEELLIHDPSRLIIKELIHQQYHLQNDPTNQFGYEVINGFPVDISKVRIMKVPKHITSIILASDGYPYLKQTLKESEQFLHNLLEEDPLCFRVYKSVKGLKKGQLSFDDRTFLKIEFNQPA